MTIKRRTLVPWLGLAAVLAAGCEIHDPGKAGNLVPKTVAQDPDLPALEVNGARFHLETFGDIANPIIIVMHGGPGSDYRPMISEIGGENASRYPDLREDDDGGLRRLADDYYLVFYDQRGAGLSERFDKSELSFEIYIDDLDAIIDHVLADKEQQTGIRDEQVILFGWSFGGTLGTGYVNAHPERVADVIFFEPGPFTKEVFNALPFENPFLMLDEPDLDEYLLSLDHLTAEDHARADYLAIVTNSRAGTYFPSLHDDGDSPVWRYGAVASDSIGEFGKVIKDDRLIANLDRFEGRALFLYGGLTTAMPMDILELNCSSYPIYELIEIPGTGHGGPWEKSSEIVDHVRAFLEEN